MQKVTTADGWRIHSATAEWKEQKIKIAVLISCKMKCRADIPNRR